jgi:hypothetical protein
MKRFFDGFWHHGGRDLTLLRVAMTRGKVRFFSKRTFSFRLVGLSAMDCEGAFLHFCNMFCSHLRSAQPSKKRWRSALLSGMLTRVRPIAARVMGCAFDPCYRSPKRGGHWCSEQRCFSRWSRKIGLDIYNFWKVVFVWEAWCKTWFKLFWFRSAGSRRGAYAIHEHLSIND